MSRLAFLVVTTAFLWGCGGDPSGPSRPDLAGVFALTELRFDPQGVLPEVDLWERLDVTDVHLVLVDDGQAQLRFVDPATNLVTAVGAKWASPTGAVRVQFDSPAGARTLLLPALITFDLSPAEDTLTFDGEPPDGVHRQRLLELVPEWTGEQLLDPVPGWLVVRLVRVPLSTGEE
jgi:hypothetical protein